jgi:hypothetical protein
MFVIDHSYRKEFMAAIGEAISHWSIVDLYLSNIIRKQIDSRNAEAFGSAISIITNMRAKLDMADAALRINIKDQTVLDRWGKLQRKYWKKRENETTWLIRKLLPCR